MLSRTAEYAVRAAILLARHYGVRLVSTDEIASVVGAPRNYLSKTLNTLTRRGILTSVRGPGGGYALAMDPSQLSVADVTDVFDDMKPWYVADQPNKGVFTRRAGVTIRVLSESPTGATKVRVGVSPTAPPQP